MPNLIQNYEKKLKLQVLQNNFFKLNKYPQIMLESEITEWRIWGNFPLSSDKQNYNL